MNKETKFIDDLMLKTFITGIFLGSVVTGYVVIFLTILFR